MFIPNRPYTHHEDDKDIKLKISQIKKDIETISRSLYINKELLNEYKNTLKKLYSECKNLIDNNNSVKEFVDIEYLLFSTSIKEIQTSKYWKTGDTYSTKMISLLKAKSELLEFKEVKSYSSISNKIEKLENKSILLQNETKELITKKSVLNFDLKTLTQKTNILEK